LLRAAGLGRLSRSLGSEVGWAKVRAPLAAHGDLRADVDQHRALWRCARQQSATLEAALAQQQRSAFADARRRRQTIPGVGPIVASTALAVFSDIARFPDAKHAASYAGLVPATYQSGERDAHGRITKRGAAERRAMLCEAAHHASRPTHPLHPYFAQLCARRGSKMAVVAVAHRLARIIVAMLRDDSDVDVGQLAVERGPFKRTVVRLYRRPPATLLHAT
jgi:transposase